VVLRHAFRNALLPVLTLSSIQLVLLAEGAPFGAIAIAASIAGFAFAFGSVIYETALQRWIAPDKLSRVASFDWLVAMSVLPIGYALAGPIANAIGISTYLWIGAIWVVVSALAVAMVRACATFRRRGGPDTASQSPARTSCAARFPASRTETGTRAANSDRLSPYRGGCASPLRQTHPRPAPRRSLVRSARGGFHDRGDIPNERVPVGPVSTTTGASWSSHETTRRRRAVPRSHLRDGRGLVRRWAVEALDQRPTRSGLIRLIHRRTDQRAPPHRRTHPSARLTSSTCFAEQPRRVRPGLDWSGPARLRRYTPRARLRRRLRPHQPGWGSGAAATRARFAANLVSPSRERTRCTSSEAIRGATG
jgi:hypothetical protein